MSFDPGSLLGWLRALESRGDPPARYLVALSGGLDSTVLLHALAATRLQHSVPLAAVHVDHGLHPDSRRWAEAAQSYTDSLGIECTAVGVTVGSAGGPEAAARDARYAALAREMRPGDWLLSAHHEDDQAETLLLNLMRGSGPAGLAAMPPKRRFGPGYLVRPLLGIPRSELVAYAEAAGLTWQEDPSNLDTAPDRNFIRHAALPLITTRWPDSRRRIARSAALAGESAALLEELADQDLVTLGWVKAPAGETAAALAGHPASLTVAAILQLSRPRAANALRRAIARAGLPAAPASRLAAVFDSLLEARDDANPVVRWPGAECRRFRDRLYLLAPALDADFEGRVLRPGEPVELGSGFGTLVLEHCDATGIAPAIAAAGLELRKRQGGEAMRPLGDAHSRKLKKLLQSYGVYPWLRDSLPLLYAGEELVAVADLCVAAAAAASPGFAVRWRDGPARS